MILCVVVTEEWRVTCTKNRVEHIQVSISLRIYGEVLLVRISPFGPIIFFVSHTLPAGKPVMLSVLLRDSLKTVFVLIVTARLIK